MDTSSVERCKHCVMPVGVVPVGDEGTCVMCKCDNHKITYRGEEAFVKLLEEHKARARKNDSRYDCIVAVSGGKDSTFAMHQLVRQYRCRVLAFNYNHSFAETTARANLERAVTALGVDLVQNNDDAEHRRYLRHNLDKLSRCSPASLRRIWGLMCTTCNDGYAKKALELARAYRIPLIIQGGCPVEPDLRFLQVSTTSAHGSWKLAVIKSALRELWDVVSEPIFYDPSYHKNVTRHLALSKVCLDMLNPFKGKKAGDDVARAHFFQFIEWDEKKIVATLQRDLGWQRPPGRSSTTRFDCRVHILLDALTSKALGVSDKEQMYSMMIRKNMLSRDEGLARIEAETKEEQSLLEPTVKEVLAKIDAAEDYDRLIRIWK